MRPSIELTVDLVKKYFNFLVTECAYNISEELQIGDKFLVYNNYVIRYSNVQKCIEIAIDVDNERFTVIVRKLTNGRPNSYKDKVNNVLATDLLFLSDDYEDYYTQINNYSHNYVERDKVIENYSRLLIKFRDELCSENWFDVDKIKRHYIDFYKRKQNVDLSSIYENKETLFGIIKRKVNFLLEQEYQLKQDAEELPTYAYKSWFAIYSDGVNDITIKAPSQQDVDYTIKVNDIKRYAIFAKGQTHENFADHVAYLIKELL